MTGYQTHTLLLTTPELGVQYKENTYYLPMLSIFSVIKSYQCYPSLQTFLDIQRIILYNFLQDLDDGKLKVWGNMAAPDLAVRYWKLKVGISTLSETFYFETDISH